LLGDDPEPLRHQVAELPPIESVVTEYRLICEECGGKTCGQLPAGVPRGAFGPRLQAVLSLLAGAYRLGKRPIQSLAADLFGRTISAGMVCKLERGAECSCKKTAGTCRRLLKQESSLWTFVWIEGIEPTNNDAERVLRHAVLWRKSSGGTDSEAGSRFVERMLSVVATARQQNHNVLELLTACCRARLDGSAAPSLLPAQAELVAA